MDHLTGRQQREIEYHRARAEQHASLLSTAVSYDVVFSPARRWWNHYWEMFTFLARQDLRDKHVLIVGCGFGEDALRLARMGAHVFAFDLSAESIALARQLAAREKLRIEFAEMPAEQLSYPDGFFDCAIARDILHHTEIPRVMAEIARVCRKDAVLVVNEVYSHSLLERLRRVRLIDRWLYPAMRGFVYQGKDPYITQDERKLTQDDVSRIAAELAEVNMRKYFGAVVGRMLPDRYPFANKLDRLMLIVLGPAARLLGGRVLIAGRLSN